MIVYNNHKSKKYKAENNEKWSDKTKQKQQNLVSYHRIDQCTTHFAAAQLMVQVHLHCRATYMYALSGCVT